jgi:hypothetical protein
MRIIGAATAISAALQIGATRAEPVAADWKKILELRTAILQSDNQGDFERAVRYAEECVTITKGTAVGSSYYCIYYLSSALRRGRGVPRDEERAFGPLNALVALNPNDDAALDLAQDYLDGAGTLRNPIEAAVVFWRVEHGAWSFYSDYWGMCNNCESLHAHAKVVGERIARELTAAEKQQSAVIAAGRFPDVTDRAKRRDRQIEAILAVVATLIGSLLWYNRFRKPVGHNP